MAVAVPVGRVVDLQKEVKLLPVAFQQQVIGVNADLAEAQARVELARPVEIAGG
jgi:hypothetical protein